VYGAEVNIEVLSGACAVSIPFGGMKTSFSLPPNLPNKQKKTFHQGLSPKNFIFFL
jgi:hypothetical protein